MFCHVFFPDLVLKIVHVIFNDSKLAEIRQRNLSWNVLLPLDVAKYPFKKSF